MLKRLAVYLFILSGDAVFGQTLAETNHLPGAVKPSVEISGNIAMVEGVSDSIITDVLREEIIYFNFYEKMQNGSWSLQDTVVEVEQGQPTVFGGGKISLHKNVAAVGYMNSDSVGDDRVINGGKVYVYERGQNGWAKTASLSHSKNWERFGRAVSVSDNTIAVLSAPFYQPKSSIYIFEKNGSGFWNRSAILPGIANPYLTRFFDIDYQGVGDSCCGLNASLFDLENDRIITLASDENGYRTTNAVVFEKGSDGEWRRTAQLPADDWSSVELHGKSAVISEKEKVTFYDLDENDMWKVNNSFSRVSNAFGWDVAIDQDYAVVLSKDMTHTFQRDERGVWFEKNMIYGRTSGSVAISGHQIVVGSGSVERQGAFVVDVELGGIVQEECVDTGVIGDGWGWNGQSSCLTDNALDECKYEDSHLNGGWGWNPARQESCEPVRAVCIDTDGDGWGWNGTASCLPSELTGAGTKKEY